MRPRPAALRRRGTTGPLRDQLGAGPRRRDRQARLRLGKSDPIDAEAAARAARAARAGTALGEPKAGDGRVEAIRTLRLARRSAVKARTQAANQLHALVLTAPDALRDRLRGLPPARLVAVAAACRVLAPATPETPGAALIAATKLTLRSLARRYRHLSAEVEALDARLAQLAATAAPELVAVKGVGTETATALLAAAGDKLIRAAARGHL